MFREGIVAESIHCSRHSLERTGWSEAQRASCWRVSRPTRPWHPPTYPSIIKKKNSLLFLARVYTIMLRRVRTFRRSFLLPGTDAVMARSSSVSPPKSAKQVRILSQIERLVSQDEGCRGTAALVQHGDLLSSAAELVEAKTVAIITGFPCLLDSDIPQETDGPLGALVVVLFEGVFNTTVCAGHFYKAPLQ